jgi:secreted Zn-dependent insulinase-like peptidase
MPKLWISLSLLLNNFTYLSLFLPVRLSFFLQLIFYSSCSQAYVAKLETSLSVVGSKLELKLYGYNDKLPILLSNILSASQSFSPKTDRFEVICFVE